MSLASEKTESQRANLSTVLGLQLVLGPRQHDKEKLLACNLNCGFTDIQLCNLKYICFLFYYQ